MDRVTGGERDQQTGASIRVVGVGGAGSNAVDRMIQVGIRGVEFIAANTDAQALARSEAAHRIVLGERVTKGLGAGGDPAMGNEAAEWSRDELAQALNGADLVFVAAGMGGGTGTGASPVVARIAREQGALTIAVVSRPFSFEGSRREAVAEEGIRRLQEEVDTLVVVSNDRLLDVINEHISLDIAFRVADEVLRQGVQGISELVSRPGLINLDFADVKAIMGRGGGALISIGHGEGSSKAKDAARIALRSPLLDIDSIKGTDGLLVNVTGGEDLTLTEVDDAMQMIADATMPHAEILFGAAIDPRMNDRVQITLIATGLGVERVVMAPAQAETDGVPFDASMMFGEDKAIADSLPAFMRTPAHAGVGWRS